MKSFPRLILLILLSISGTRLAGAATYTGTVRSVSGDVATVSMVGDMMPPNGTRAEFFFKIAGIEDEISVGTGSVLRSDGSGLLVKIENTTGTIESGQSVRLVSDGPGVRMTPAPTVASAPTPVSPAADKTTSEKKTYFDEGLAKSRIKDYKAAVEAYGRSIQLDPNFAEAYINRALSYLKLKQLRPALTDLNEALRLKPDFVAAHSARGDAYVGLHQYEKAIADYDEAIRLDPNDAGAYNNRGAVYIETRRYKKAIEDLTKAIELDPAYPGAFVNRANAYEMMGKKQLAKADLARAKELEAAGH